jgi:hypothetical protein
MDTKTYDDVMHHFLKGAKESLMHDGHLIPYLFALLGPVDKPTFLPLPITAETQLEKAAFAQYARRRLKETGAWGYVVVTDSWVLHKDDFSPPDFLNSYMRPSQHPKHRDALFVMLETNDYRISVAAPYERTGETILFLKEITYPPEVCAVGHFANLLKEK